MNKRTLLVVLVFLFLQQIGQAQDFRYGVLAGINVSNIRIKYFEDVENEAYYDPTLTFNLNGHFSYKSAGFIGVSCEPGFIIKSGSSKDANDERQRFNQYYVQLPILADFYVSNRIFLSIGPEFAYMLKAKVTTEGDPVEFTQAIDNRFEISGIVGISYILSNNLECGLRYSHGFTYTLKIDDTDTYGQGVDLLKQHNHYMQILVRYKF